MCRSIKRMISLLLALVLLFSLSPAVFAVSTDSQDEVSEPPVTTVQPTEQNEESTEFKEAEPTPLPTEEPVDFSFSESNSIPEKTEEANENETSQIASLIPPQQLIAEEGEPVEYPSDEEIMLLSATTGNLMFFNLSKPDYTVRMNTQVTVLYPENGNGTVRTAYIKNIGWHYASPNKNHTIYCIEPYKDYAESTSYNAVDEGVTLTGSAGTHGEEVWYSLPLERRQAIALILLYSNERWDHSVDVTTTSRDNNPNVPLRVATQFLIYEIVTGLRDANTFNRLSSNGYTAGDVFYNAGCANVSGFDTHYNALESSIKAHLKIPSFTSKDSSSAPTITMTGSSTAVTDTNGVLTRFNFSNGSGATFSKSGNTLTIGQSGTISESTVFSCSTNLFSPEASTYSLWYSPYISSYQTCVSLYGSVKGEVKAYFKIKAETKGAIEIIKNTNTGADLSGWKFDVYKDSACTQLYGTYTAGDDGKVKITDVPLGTYYIREQGSSDPYWVCDTSTKTVIVASNQTSNATFTNAHNGKGTFRKTTNTGENLEGWMITVYRDADCSDPIKTLTTGADGTVSMMLEPGIYYAAETDDTHGRFADEYWMTDNTVQKLEIKAGQESSVTFTNTHYGKAKIIKVMPTGGSTAGWGFEVRRASDNELIGTFTTEYDGSVTTGRLEPGEYIITEIIPADSYYKNESGNPHRITVAAGETAEVTMSNVLIPGEITIHKVNHEGTNLEGVEFLLEWSEDLVNWHPVTFSDSDRVTTGGCTASNLVDGKLITDANGYVSFTGLHPQLHYRVTETATLDGYQLLTEAAFEGTLTPESGFAVELQVVNCPEFKLPMTGGNGLQHFTAMGNMLMGIAVFVFNQSMKKRKE